MDNEDIEKQVLRAIKELNKNTGVTIPEIVSYVMSDYADHRERVKSAVTKVVKRILLKKRGKGVITSICGYYRLCRQRNKAKPIPIYRSGFIFGSCPVCGKRPSKKVGKGSRRKRSQSRKGKMSKRSQSRKGKTSKRAQSGKGRNHSWRHH